MKKLFMALGLAFCMSFGVVSNAAAQEEVQEPCAYTVILLSDGTRLVFEGELTDAQIGEIYDLLDP